VLLRISNSATIVQPRGDARHVENERVYAGLTAEGMRSYFWACWYEAKGEGGLRHATLTEVRDED
jgi:hypothetical protein